VRCVVLHITAASAVRCMLRCSLCTRWRHRTLRVAWGSGVVGGSFALTLAVLVTLRQCCCSISPVCIDSPTLRGGMAEGRRLAAATFDPQDLGIPQEVW
jgi:hypothetical protein